MQNQTRSIRKASVGLTLISIMGDLAHFVGPPDRGLEEAQEALHKCKSYVIMDGRE